MTPQVRVLLVRVIEEHLALATLRDLVAPFLERLAQDRSEADTHEVERRQHLDRPDVGRRGVLRCEREPPGQRDRDSRIAIDEVGLREGSDCPRLPEGPSGIRRRTICIDGPVPVADEIAKTPIVELHVEDEVDEPGRPLSQAAVTRVAVQIEKENDGARRVVDTGNALEPLVASGQTVVLVVRVHAESDRATTSGGNLAGEPCELPDHLGGQGSRLAMISFTEKSAAAMHESAAP